jgi:hypothetical protein
LFPELPRRFKEAAVERGVEFHSRGASNQEISCKLQSSGHAAFRLQGFVLVSFPPERFQTSPNQTRLISHYSPVVLHQSAEWRKEQSALQASQCCW